MSSRTELQAPRGGGSSVSWTRPEPSAADAIAHLAAVTVGEGADVPAGASKDKTFTLSVGSYVAFCNVVDLATRPVWLFSVSSVGDKGSFFSPAVARLLRKRRSETKEITGFRNAVHAPDHHGFAGAIERSHWPLSGHLFLKALGGHYGDHGDWDEIDEWADGHRTSVAVDRADGVCLAPGRAKGPTPRAGSRGKVLGGRLPRSMLRTPRAVFVNVIGRVPAR